MSDNLVYNIIYFLAAILGGVAFWLVFLKSGR